MAELRRTWREAGWPARARLVFLLIMVAVLALTLAADALTLALAHPWLALALAVLLAGRGIAARIESRSYL
jgi:hypothetical protein